MTARRKPLIGYRVAEHAERLEAFISGLGLVEGASKLALVLHDWGSALGLDWARRHESAVAGLVLMEFILPCPTWLDFPVRAREIFRRFRTKDVGRDLIIGENAFIERILPAGVVRTLAAAEMRAYRAPFVEL
jgi:haloalkane dehalogenase